MRNFFVRSDALRLCTERWFSVGVDIIFRFLGLYTCAYCAAFSSILCEQCAKKFRYSTPSCSLCEAFSEKGEIHPQCMGKGLAYHYCLSLYDYFGAIRALLRVYKYECAFQYQRAIQVYLDRYFEIDPFCVIRKWQHIFECKRILLIPVPMSSAKFTERGFNPAVEFSILFARNIERRFNSKVTVAPHLLLKRSDMRSQARKRKNERLLSLTKSFSIAPEVEHLLLASSNDIVCVVDDVVTTGATTTAILDTFATSIKLKSYLQRISLIRLSFASSSKG